jgi:hypothetical protein
MNEILPPLEYPREFCRPVFIHYKKAALPASNDSLAQLELQKPTLKCMKCTHHPTLSKERSSSTIEVLALT